MFGCLGIVTGVPSNIVFNLALPTIFSLAAINLYAIGTLLLEKFRWLPFSFFLSQIHHFFIRLAQGKALNTVLWDSTRTIANTINEYPLFSFIWGDVHAHVVSLFNQVFLIFLLLYAYKRWESLENRAKWLVSIFCALSLGSMPLFNTWDVLIYAPIMILFGVLIIWRVWKKNKQYFILLAPVCSPATCHPVLSAILPPVKNNNRRYLNRSYPLESL